MRIEGYKNKEQTGELSVEILEMVAVEPAHLKVEKAVKHERGRSLIKAFGVLTLAAAAMAGGLQGCDAVSERMEPYERSRAAQSEKIRQEKQLIEKDAEKNPEIQKRFVKEAVDHLSSILGEVGGRDRYPSGISEGTRDAWKGWWNDTGMAIRTIEKNPDAALFGFTIPYPYKAPRIVFRGSFQDVYGKEKDFEVIFEDSMPRFYIVSKGEKFPSEFSALEWRELELQGKGRYFSDRKYDDDIKFMREK